MNPTADSRGVRTAIQNHAAWLVNGIISDTREHRVRCCPGSLPRDLLRPSSPSVLSLVVASLHPENGVVSVAPCGNRPLTFLSLSLSLSVLLLVTICAGSSDE